MNPNELNIRNLNATQEGTEQVNCIDRRRFLGSSLLTAGLTCATQFLPLRLANAAAPNGQTDPARVLYVFLRGACDTDSVIFQPDNAFYYDSRPNIAIGRRGSGSGLLEIAPGWALHPGMLALHDLIAARQLCFLPFFGSGDLSRSHFSAQAVMEKSLLPGIHARPTGRASGPASHDPVQGFANRTLQALAAANPDRRLDGFYTSEQTPLACEGAATLFPVKLKPVAAAQPARLARQLQALRQLYADAETADQLTLASQRRAALQSTLESVRPDQSGMQGMAHGASSRSLTNLSEHFRLLAQLMRSSDEYSVGFTDVGGWDTHVNQGNENGQLSNKLSELAEALALFAQSCGPVWTRTHVLIVSEFGRTFQENGNRGTDHGHGSTVMLLSGRPFRQVVAGKTMRYGQGMLNEGRDAPLLNSMADLQALFDPLRRVT